MGWHGDNCISDTGISHLSENRNGHKIPSGARIYLKPHLQLAYINCQFG